MIHTDEQLDLTLEQLGRAYRALAALRAEVPPRSDAWFTLMAEGPVIQIRQLLREIDEYTGAAVLDKESPTDRMPRPPRDGSPHGA